jgi:hypothetical protein
LPASKKRAHEVDRRRLEAQLVRIDLPARQDEAVVVLRTRLAELDVDLDLVAPVLLLPAADRAALGRHQVDGGAGLLEGALGLDQLRLLEAVGARMAIFLLLQS